MVGYLEFLPQPVVGDDASTTSTAEPEEIEFIKAHAEFLAKIHPAALLGAAILYDKDNELKVYVVPSLLHLGDNLLIRWYVDSKLTWRMNGEKQSYPK